MKRGFDGNQGRGAGWDERHAEGEVALRGLMAQCLEQVHLYSNVNAV